MITKEEQKIKHIQFIIGDSNYNDLIKKQLEFLSNEFVNAVHIILNDNEKLLIEEKIYKSGKIVWEKPETQFPRKPQAIMIDVLNIKGLAFLFTFLHECGHLKDYNNLNIQIQTKKSEISAWKHAYEDIKTAINFSEIEDVFFNYAEKSLMTYKITLKNIRELININLMTIIE